MVVSAGAGPIGGSGRAYRLALEVRTREALPAAWVETQQNLGLSVEAAGDQEPVGRVERCGKALACFDAYRRCSIRSVWR